MKIIRINHLGIAPKNPDVAKSFFDSILNLENVGEETVADQKVKVTFFQSEKSRLEILEATEEASPVAKFVTERGGGIQHIALEVDNLEEWLAALKQKGVQLIDPEPRIGAHHTKIAFIHPRSTGGILVELTQEMKGN
ncbi:MAG: methylmalonyl-CoA epimerase [Silvanigrellaceae bacterium]